MAGMVLIEVCKPKAVKFRRKQAVLDLSYFRTGSHIGDIDEEWTRDSYEDDSGLILGGVCT